MNYLEQAEQLEHHKIPTSIKKILIEADERNRLLEEVFHHAKSLSLGKDWNNGTAATFHRKALVEAINKIEGVN